MESAKIEKYHIKANASFAIREGWLTKGLRHVHDQEDIFLRDDAIDQLGMLFLIIKSKLKRSAERFVPLQQAMM